MSVESQPNNHGLKWVKRLLVSKLEFMRSGILFPAFDWVLCPNKDTSLCAVRITLYIQGTFEVSYIKDPRENFPSYNSEAIERWASSHGYDAPPSLREAMSVRQEFWAQHVQQGVSGDNVFGWLKSQWAKLADEALHYAGDDYSPRGASATPAPAAPVDEKTREFLNKLLGDIPGIDDNLPEPASQ